MVGTQKAGDPPAGRAPLVIGVAGGSGSGKTTVVRRIIESIGDDQVTVLEHDRYYRDRNDLRLEERAALNYDHPDSLETDLLVRHVHELRAGRPVEVPHYDFARHARKADTMTVQPRKAIIVEGILVFADAALRALMDVKVFVDTDDDTRFIRRLQRDIAERGRTMSSVIEQYLGTVKPMHLEFVEPSKRYADIIIPVGGHNTVAIDVLLTLMRGLAAPDIPPLSFLDVLQHDRLGRVVLDHQHVIVELGTGCDRQLALTLAVRTEPELDEREPVIERLTTGLCLEESDWPVGPENDPTSAVLTRQLARVVKVGTRVIHGCEWIRPSAPSAALSAAHRAPSLSTLSSADRVPRRWSSARW